MAYPITIPSKFLFRVHTPSSRWVWVYHPLPPDSFLRSLSFCLKRDTLREMAIYVVTETICNRHSVNTPFLAIDPSFLPPTTFAASWSME